MQLGLFPPPPCPFLSSHALPRMRLAIRESIRKHQAHGEMCSRGALRCEHARILPSGLTLIRVVRPEPSPETAPLLGRSRSKTNRTKIGSILLVVLLLLPLAVLNGVQYAGYIYVRSATSTAQAQLSVTRTQLASVRHERVREEATWTAERRWRADQRALEDAAWTAETKRRTNLRVREELDWAAERRHRAQQAAREEAAWAAEGRQRAAQRARENTEWAAENERRKEQRWREDAEKRDAEERARMNLYWDVPQRGEHCARYGAREYSARLFNIKDGYDWVTACERTPVVIHGNVIAKPDWCQVRVSGISSIHSGFP
jgi:hypothetical protein